MPAFSPQKENLTTLKGEPLLLYAQQTKTASDDKFGMNPIVHAHPSSVGPSVDMYQTYMSHLCVVLLRQNLTVILYAKSFDRKTWETESVYKSRDLQQ